MAIITFKGLTKFFALRAIEVAVILVLIVIMPNIPPNAKFSKSFSIPKVDKLEGALSLNDKLDNLELWHKGELFGPESFREYKGDLYTTLNGGDVVKLSGNHITPVVKFGKPCKGFHEESKCGRPLGMDFDANGILYVCDAYYGVFKVNPETGKYQQLVSMDQEIGGVKPKIPNSIAVASNDDLYWSDSSTEFSLEDGVIDLLADGSGRLIHYNAKTGENTILIDNLLFANGVKLSDDETYVLVAEIGTGTIHRYHLKGPKKGSRDVFVDGLPGAPDNINTDGKGGYLVSLVIGVDPSYPSAFQILRPFPLIRKLIARLFGLTELGFRLLNQVYPNELADKALHMVGHFTTVHYLFTPKRTTIVRLSKDGEILSSLHTNLGEVTGICDAFVYNGKLHLGSPFNDFIARISLDEIGWSELAKTAVPSKATTTTTQKATTTTTPKPTTTTTPKPTTTTPKPTTTTTPKPTTTTPKPTTTTPKPTTTTTPKPTTTTPKPTTTTTPKPTTTTPKPTTTTTPKPTTTSKPSTKATPKDSATTTKPTTATPKSTTTTAQKSKSDDQKTTSNNVGGGGSASPIKEQQKTVPVK